MLIDESIITIKAGNGGNGAVSFRRNAQTAKGGPDGGNGGNGGSIYFQGSTNIFDLKEFQFKKHVQAEDGVAGARQKLFGRNGQDLIVLIPVGTSIIDIDTGSRIEITKDGEKILVAKGGIGGRGNTEFKSATQQTPQFAEKGQTGEQKKLQLILKSIADIGFVGLPNSGKSTLLSLLTNAKPKIGNYAFTTLDPNLGKTSFGVLADIPGIIEGASKGKGLGFKFLKHIEKTKALFYCIDSSSDNPLESYRLIRKEFEIYDPQLLSKPEVIVLTKTDLISPEEIKKKKDMFAGKTVVITSEKDTVSIENLQKLLRKTISD